MNGVPEWLFGTEPIQWVQQFFGLGHPLPFRIFSLLGDTWGILLVVGLAFWLFGRRTMYALVGIVVVGAATKLFLSDFFNVSRPEGPGIMVYEHLEVGSFPSGHVYEAVGPWGLLYALGCVPLWVPALIAALVGLGRLYLGTHYLADVLAGIAFGVLLVWLYAKAWPPVQAWLRERGWAFYATLAVVVIGGTLAWMTTVGAHPRRYEVFGLILGAAVGLPLEYRFLRYEPGRDAWATRIGKVLIGLLGVAACLLWDRSRPEDALLLGILTAGLATLWAILGAPALFAVLGLDKNEEKEVDPAEGETLIRPAGEI
jgi:membrane-associated phospholipid phosphatase